MEPQHLCDNSSGLKESLFQPALPVEGLKILAGMICRRLQKERQQSKYDADDTVSDNDKQYIHRREKEEQDG